MRRIPRWSLACSVLSAVLLDLPFPLAGPLPVWRAAFAWIALAPILAAILRLAEQREQGLKWVLGWSFLAGWLGGALWFGLNCYWVFGTMNRYGDMGPALAALCLLLFSLFLGFWWGVLALAIALFRMTTGKRWLTVAAIPVLWVAMEFCLARVPSFPWDQLGDSQVDNALLMRLVPWTGVYGVSLLIAAVNAVFAGSMLDAQDSKGSWQKKYGWRLIFAASLLLSLALDGPSQQPPKPPVQATAVLVQPNLDVVADNVWTEAQWTAKLAEFGRLAAETCKQYLAGMPETGAPMGVVECGPNPEPPALIAWPESPAPFREPDAKFRSAMAAIVKAERAPMIVGNIGMDLDEVKREYKIHNSASIVSQDGDFVGRYDKIHLVPFGEYIPYRGLFFFAHQLTQNLEDLEPGVDRKTFRIGSGQGAHRYGIFICYESVFADEVRQFTRMGAEVLVNISDDGWYGDTSAPWQHLNMARMRAIENHRWLLRDTNNGTTASIDPYGTVRQSIPRHQTDALPAEFGYETDLTWYTVHGDVLAQVCAILSLALLVWSVRRLLSQLAGRA